ncbi:MAG: DUF2723 domain-containing protein [candidate division WOR-3 bacterium]
MSSNLLKPRFYIPVFLFIIITGIYTYSLCPTVYLIDSGELGAVSYTLGIAHPTGYPLYTLISYFVAHFPGEPIRNLNFLSALFSAVAAVFLYFTTYRILEKELLSITIASLYAFSLVIWRTSITNEVYPLTGLFCIVLLYSLYNLKDSRTYYALMFVAGLSLTNHIIIFSLVIPVILYTLIVYKPTAKKIIAGLIFIAIGLSIYLYLLFRTLGGAELAWGNTCNIQRLVWHITGRQYQVWMFSLSSREILNNIQQGITLIARNFLYLFVIFMFAGIYWLFKNDRKKLFLFLGIFLLNFLYTVNYAIPDIESYYIPGFIGLLFVSIYGLKMWQKHMKGIITIPLSLIIPIINYSDCTLRNNTFGLDYSLSHFVQLPENSLLVCSYWDIYSPTIYLRKVKHFRKDVVIIDKELLRRTWYIKYLRNEYPDLFFLAEKQINDYLVELYKFEYGRPYDPQVIQEKYIKMLEKFVDAKESTGAFFALPFPDYDLNGVKPHYLRIPFGPNYLITQDRKDMPFDFSALQIDLPDFVNDQRMKYNIDFLKKMVINNINYLYKTGDSNQVENVQKWLRRLTLKKER